MGTSTTNVDLDLALQVARAAAREAGELLRRGACSAFTVEHKGAVDLVTEHDRRSEELVVRRLGESFPAHEIIAEEGTVVQQHQNAPAVWYVDPLDGTTNFAHGLPWYAVSLGLELSGQPAVAVVLAPELGWEFWAARDRGCWTCQGAQQRRLQVSHTAQLCDSLVATGFPYDRAFCVSHAVPQMQAVLQRSQGIRRMGVASLDCAMVASGKLDGYWETQLKPWDICAGALLVREAGGRVSDLDGGPFDSRSGRILASNGHIHHELGQVLGALERPANA